MTGANAFAPEDNPAECSLPPGLPADVSAVLSSAPPLGKGLFSWIRPTAVQLLHGGRSPTEVAQLLHLIVRRYPQLAEAEIRSLKGGPF
jgi:hypothetical protein